MLRLRSVLELLPSNLTSSRRMPSASATLHSGSVVIAFLDGGCGRLRAELRRNEGGSGTSPVVNTQEIFVVLMNEMPKGQGIPKQSVQSGPRGGGKEWGPGGSNVAWGSSPGMGVWEAGEGRRVKTSPVSSQYTGLRAVGPGCEKLAHQVCATSQMG